MKKEECEYCHDRFKDERILEQHIDVHTPYWKRKKIVLSGGDQILLALKDMQGGWKKYKSWLTRNKRFDELTKAEKIQKFERDNKIQFLVCGVEVREYRCLQ